MGARQRRSLNEWQRAVGRLAKGVEQRLFVEDAESAAHRRLAIAEHVISESEAWSEILGRRLEHLGAHVEIGGIVTRAGDTAQVGELAIDFIGRIRVLIPHAEVERQARCEPEIVLEENAEEVLTKTAGEVRSERRPLQPAVVSRPEAQQIR